MKARGMSDSAIARAIGRDSSLISQISRGKKPGANLAPALKALSEGRKPRAPERRKTKTGERARTRGLSKRTYEFASGSKNTLSALRDRARKGASVSIMVRLDEWRLSSKGGAHSEPYVYLYKGLVSASKVISDFEAWRADQDEGEPKTFEDFVREKLIDKTGNDDMGEIASISLSSEPGAK
jgi:hypothetical protein